MNVIFWLVVQYQIMSANMLPVFFFFHEVSCKWCTYLSVVCVRWHNWHERIFPMTQVFLPFSECTLASSVVMVVSTLYSQLFSYYWFVRSSDTWGIETYYLSLYVIYSLTAALTLCHKRLFMLLLLAVNLIFQAMYNFLLYSCFVMKLSTNLSGHWRRHFCLFREAWLSG